MSGLGRIAVLAVFTVAALEGGARASSTTCWHYTLDYEGEERSWVGWSPMKVPFRNVEKPFSAADERSAVILGAKVSWTLPLLSFECGSPKDGAWLVQLLPSLNLQLLMMTQQSSAVLPPSFNPRILRIAVRHRRWFGSVGGVPGKVPNGVDWAVGAILTIWSHHSNGQYGGTYLDALGQETNDLTAAVKANRENGDFATNYAGVKAWMRRSRLDRNGDMPTCGFTASAEYQFHHGALPGHLIDRLKPIWGQHHFLVDAEFRTGFQQERSSYVAPPDGVGRHYFVYSVKLWAPLGGEDHPIVSSAPIGVTAEAAWFVPRYLGSMGVLLQATWGRNPLNIRFVEDRNAILVGLVLDTSQSIGRFDEEPRSND